MNSRPEAATAATPSLKLAPKRRSAKLSVPVSGFRCTLAEHRKPARPLATCSAAAGPHTRLRRIVDFLDCVDESLIETEGFCKQNRRMPALSRARTLGQEKAACRRVEVLQFGQTRMREMDVGEAVVALPPGISGARDIAEHRRCNCFPIRG